MTAISVWIKLYMSKDDQNPSVFKIKDFTGDVDDLKEKIKEKELLDFPASRLDVYPQGTDVSDLEGIDEIDAWDSVPLSTSGKDPLIVIPNEQWLQQQVPIQTQTGRDAGDRDEMERSLRKVSAERDALRVALLLAKTTTERALSASDDLLYSIFQDAPIESIWFPPLSQEQTGSWDAPWETYAVTDKTRTESKTIQPIFQSEFISKFPSSSRYEIVDTHSGWNQLTQDVTLFLRERSKVELTIAAIIELVGQDETGFPSKKHKAKFLRDCMRIYRRCGSNRVVHGIITDLSRIIAVKMTGVDDAFLPNIVKTAVLEGDEVQNVLTQVAFASPDMLCVEAKIVEFPGDGDSVSGSIIRPPLSLECGKVLGRGLHGTVYTVVGADRAKWYIKYFPNHQECQKESVILRRLMSENIPNIPTLMKVSQDGHAILGTPVGKDSHFWQGRGIVWRFGLLLLDTLQQLHANNFCHRDVRPNNIVVIDSGQPVLIDWVSVAIIGEEVDQYIGTAHYASVEVLDSLIDYQLPTPSAKHDLESLVYSIYSLSREPTDFPRAMKIEKTPGRPITNFYIAIRKAWQEEAQRNRMLGDLVEAARNWDYETLKREFARKF